VSGDTRSTAIHSDCGIALESANRIKTQWNGFERQFYPGGILCPLIYLQPLNPGDAQPNCRPQNWPKSLKDIPSPRHKRLLVGIETHDDAGVYKLTDDIAIIQTVDFFPPRMLRPL